MASLMRAPEDCKNGASGMGLFSSVMGHVGDGNFHQMIMYNPNKPEEKAAVKAFIDDMMRQAVALEGTVSGEHGIGIGKKASCPGDWAWQTSPELFTNTLFPTVALPYRRGRAEHDRCYESPQGER